MARDFIFMHRVTDIDMEDEERRSFMCSVGRTANQAFVRRKSKVFCTANQLRGGSKLLLGINHFGPTTIYVKVLSR